jgi:hypothetical protein
VAAARFVSLKAQQQISAASVDELAEELLEMKPS